MDSENRKEQAQQEVGEQGQDWGELKEALTWGPKFKKVPPNPVIKISSVQSLSCVRLFVTP